VEDFSKYNGAVPQTGDPEKSCKSKDKSIGQCQVNVSNRPVGNITR
jgi:hypothetical protein